MERFDDNKNIKTYKDKAILKRLLTYAKPVKWYFILSLIFTGLLVLVDLLPANLEGELIGVLGDVEKTMDEKIRFVIILMVFYACAIVAGAFLNYFNT